MRDLTTVFVEACQNAAIACHPWIGKGNKEAADAAAVEAMRAVFNASDMDGRIVIGEESVTKRRCCSLVKMSVRPPIRRWQSTSLSIR